MMVALGMPVLIGGTGLAVDTAQWYSWKQELQFATDQAAMAGAYAASKEMTEGDYATRADQEYTANLQVTDSFASEPSISLANYSGGTLNSVLVSASATKELPFSGFLTNAGTTITVRSQAQFEAGATYTSCIIATDEDDDGAITISGNATLRAGCGMAALSTSDTAITINGNPEVLAGYVLAAGGIDEYLMGTNKVLEYQTGLEDPYKDLVPPNNPTPRQLSCPKKNTAATYIGDEYVTVTLSYSYYKGQQSHKATPTSYPNGKQGSSTDYYNLGKSFTSMPQDGVQTADTWKLIVDDKKNSIWEKKTEVSDYVYENVELEDGSEVATALPGTYTDFTVNCDTVMQEGIYVINGGSLDINAQDALSGNGVMFVLKGGANIKINGGAEINLTAMNASQLIAAGVPSDQAGDLAGMLLFEDPNSDGTTKRNILNGNASTVLNGLFYLPKSHVEFKGTAGVTSRCFMLAAATIDIGGTADMSSFCPPDEEIDDIVASTEAIVRLVG
jgi:Flp pilus assembly protein TadG